MNKFKATLRSVKDFLWLLFDHKMGRAGIIIFALFLILAIFAPVLRTRDPKKTGDVSNILTLPSREFLLGTDDLARDIWSQIIYGSRMSLTIGFMAGLFSIAIGSFVGLIAGFFGGRLEEFLMRVVDFFMMLPELPLMIVLSAVLGPSLWNIIMVVSIVNWPTTARVVRSQVLSLKERAFVESSRCIGASNSYLIFREILPNVIPLILAQTVLMVTYAIYAESVLSFLGLGDPTIITWGMMLHFAFESGAMSGAIYWVIPPIICIVTLILGFTFFGTAVSDIMKPGYRETKGMEK